MLLREYLNTARRHYPNNIALDLASEQLSYQTLYRLSNQFACGLTALGITANARVAIWLPKITTLYISVFGTLEHGSTYIPIDMSMPFSSVIRILENALVDVLICRNADYHKIYQALSKPVTQAVVIEECFDTKLSGIISWQHCMKFGENPVQQTRTPDIEDLAYILYTSGSTGQPKGVAISHRAASSFIEWSSAFIGLHEQDRVSNHAALSFDLSIFDLFATLKAGATLVPVSSPPLALGYFYAHFIEKKQISVWYSVPTLLIRIIESQQRKPLDLSCLHTVIFAGEPMQKKDLIKLHECLPNAKLHNWYGPTETNVCTYHVVNNRDLADQQSTPIGIPCPYAKIKISNQSDDGIGELLVAGDSLMSGYWENTAACQDSFIYDDADKCLYYPTGDLVSWRNNLLHFHGRRDAQIKRHGYRIELGEIESRATDIKEVSKAAAVFVNTEIIVFVTLNAMLSADTVKKYLLEHTPPYMHPNSVIVIEQLPETSRGKLDRKKLESFCTTPLYFSAEY